MALPVFTSPASVSAPQTTNGFVHYITLAVADAISITCSGTVPPNTYFHLMSGVSGSLDAAAVSFSWSADGLPTAGAYPLAITATNSSGSTVQNLTITVTPAAPVILSASTGNGTRGAALMYDIMSTPRPCLSYGASGLPPGMLISTVDGHIYGTPTTAGVFTSTVSATTAGGTTNKTVTFTIAGALPVINSALTKAGVQGTPITPYTVTATNTPTSFNATGLPAGLSIDTGTGVITGTPLVNGTVNSTITATNIDGTGSATLVWTLAQVAPVITSPLTASCNQGTAFNYTIVATNSPTSYNATGLPAGLSINTGTGAITGTPPIAAVTNVTISATNGAGTATATLVIAVGAVAAPIITSSLSASGTAGTPFTYTIVATNTPTSFSAISLPPGLSINTSLGIISGTPSAPGLFPVTIGATNIGGSDNETLNITIVAIPPVITSPTTTTQQQGYAFSYAIVAANTPYAYSATGLPAGLTLDTGTGVITGIPSGTGTYNVVLHAINTAGTDTITLVITLAPGNPIPTITSGVLATVVTGAPYNYTITTDVTPVTYGASGLPAGLSFNSLTGTISGSVTNPGVTYVSLSATNGTGTGTATLVITAQVPAPVITSSLAATANQFTAFAYDITATNTPTSYNAVGLPLGLSINTVDGHISGSLIGEAGDFYITISATNARGTDTKTLVLTVNIPPPLVITSSLAVTLQVDTPLDYTIVATNSPTLFTATGLPAGLHLNRHSGLIYGTPTAATVSNITLTATNVGGTITASLVLAVTLPAPKTVHGSGVMVSPRAAIWGTGFVLDRAGAARVAAKPDQPLDEAKVSRFPVNVPGSAWAAQ